MNKLLMIIVLGFLCSGSAFANKKENAKALGYGANKVDFNFECKDGKHEKNFGFHKIFSKKLNSDVFIALPVHNNRYSMPVGMVQNFGPQTVKGEKYDVMMVYYHARYSSEMKTGFLSKYVVLSKNDNFLLQDVMFKTSKKNYSELTNILNLYDRIAFTDPQKGLDLLLEHHIKARELSSKNKEKNYFSTYSYKCNVTK